MLFKMLNVIFALVLYKYKKKTKIKFITKFLLRGTRIFPSIKTLIISFTIFSVIFKY